MTISNAGAIVTQTGNNATTVWNYSFQIPYQADDITPAVAVSIATTVNNVTTIVTLAPSQYSISGVGNASGGTVTYPLSGSPLAPNQTITIARALAYTQSVAVANQAFLPNVVEQTADQLEMQIQQIVAQLPISLNPVNFPNPYPVLTLSMFPGVSQPNTGSDSAPCIQAAVNAASSGGGGIVFIGPGVYTVSSFTLPSNVRLVGSGIDVTTLQTIAVPTAPMIVVAAGATSYEVSDLTINGQSNTAPHSLISYPGATAQARFRRIKFYQGSTVYWALRGDFIAAFKDIEILECKFVNCTGGGIYMLPTVQGSKGLRIKDNLFDNVGGVTNANCCFIGDVAADRGTGGCYFNVEITGNTWTNLSQYSIACEPWSCTNLIWEGNVIDSGYIGYSDINPLNANVANNIFLNMFKALETGGPGSVACHIHNNTFRSNNYNISIDNTANSPVTDTVIQDNKFYGSGLSAQGTSDSGAIVANVVSAWFYNLVIKGNEFYDCEWYPALINIRGTATDATTSITIEDNTAVGSTVNSTVGFTITGTTTNGMSATRVNVRNNNWYRTAALTHTNVLQSDVFELCPASAMGTQQIFENNTVNMQGTIDYSATVGNCTFFNGIGCVNAIGAAYGITVSGNRFIGNYGSNTKGSAAIVVKTSTSDAIVMNNDTYGVVEPSGYFTRYFVGNTFALQELPWPPCLIANLPPDVPIGTRGFITNGVSSPTFGGAVSSTGSTPSSVICTGPGAWIYQ